MRAHGFPFLKAEGTVVDAGGQAETIFGKGCLAAEVALEHAADLRNGNVAFIDEDQRVVRQVFKQGWRRFAWFSAREIARIIFNAGAGAGGHHHFDIKVAALLKPLGFQQAACGVEFDEALFEVNLDAAHGLLKRGLRRHVVRVGIDFDLLKLGLLLARERIEFGDGFDFVTEERKAPSTVFKMRGEKFHRIAAHAEGTAHEVCIVALIVQLHEICQQLALGNALALFHLERHGGIGFHIADAIDAGHRRHHDHIIALQQRAGGGVAHAVDLLVDGAFLFDEGVGAGDIGFRRVVIIIGDEIFHGVFREEGRELAIELGGECLVGREDQGRALGLLDDLRHSEGFARTGDAEQNLVALFVLDAVHQFGDGRGLVALGFKGGDDLEGAATVGLCLLDRLEGYEIGQGIEFRADGTAGHGYVGVALDRCEGCFGESAFLS